MFKPHVPGRLWSIESTFQIKGIPKTSRMTIIRLSSGPLLLHSPIPLNEQIRGRLEVLGPVGCIVTPNCDHHLFLSDYQAAFPQALMFAAPHLKEKRPDLTFADVLTGEAPALWAKDLEQMIFYGPPDCPEVLFFDPGSRTLIVGDLCFHYVSDLPFRLKFLTSLRSLYGRLAPGPGIKLAKVNKPAARSSLQKLLQWDFDRILLAHGQPIETGGKAKLAQTLNFLQG